MSEGDRRDRDGQLRVGSGLRRRVVASFLVAWLLLPTTGCATMVRLANYPEAPQVLGGIRTYDGLYEELGYVNMHGLDSGVKFIVAFFAVDLLATIALDLLLLPITVPTAFAYQGSSDSGDEYPEFP